MTLAHVQLELDLQQFFRMDVHSVFFREEFAFVSAKSLTVPTQSHLD